MGWFKHFVDVFFGLGMFVNGTLFIPQAYRLWKEKSAKNLSAVMFCGFVLIQLFSVLYGYFHEVYLLMIGMAYSMLTCGVTTALIFKYRQ